ncbi:MAG: cohesin domain-containing protein [Pyrinomonadaceae bacterium]
MDNNFTAGVSDAAGRCSVSVEMPDGRILVGGYFDFVNGISLSGIARLNSDGSIDTTFNPGGIGATGGSVSDIALLSDGKILIVGNFSSYNGFPAVKLARLNADGSFDPTFNESGSGVTSSGQGLNAIAVQPDGKIIIAGPMTAYNGISSVGFARLNSDGTFDNSFVSGFTGAMNVYKIVLQPDGKIVLGLGARGSYGGVSAGALLRINTDATLDTQFNNGSGTNASSQILGVAIQNDGKIVFCGYFTSFNGITRKRIARVNVDGTLDTGFTPPDFPNTGGAVIDVLVQNDGQILATGDFDVSSGYYVGVVRLNPDGTQDLSFIGLTDNQNIWVTLQSDGNLLVTGWFGKVLDHVRLGIARYGLDGALDASFNPTFTTYGNIRSMVRQPDDKVAVAGEFTTANGNSSHGVARFNADGTFDNSFNVGLGPLRAYFLPAINRIALQPDGKILVGGWFNRFNGLERNSLVRLNSDGSVDTSFNPPRLVYGFYGIQDIIVLSDGKIMVCGVDLGASPTAPILAARLNPDGSFDPTFSVSGFGTIFSSNMYRMLQQPDGKIIVGGNYWTSISTSRKNFARLHGNGARDTSFTELPQVGTVSDADLLGNGKIVWTSGGTVNRLNNNGTTDAGFSVSTFGHINSLALQTDGKVIAGGVFTQIGGVPRDRIARLNADGGLDSAFVSGIFTVNTNPYDANSNYFNGVNSLMFDPDEKLYVAGGFSAYDGVSRSNLLRLVENSQTPTPTSTPTATATPTATSTPTPLPGVSGTITYGNAVGSPNPRFVSNVNISAAGPSNLFTSTAFPGGDYSLSGFLVPGTYVVSPTKTTGVNGITSFDAARVAQHVAGINVLTGAQFTVADASGNSSLSSFDAGLIARYVAGQPDYGLTTRWVFQPPNRIYSDITTNITGQDFTALLMGEVSGNWANTGARAVNSGQWIVDSKDEIAGRNARVPAAGGIAIEFPTLTSAVDKEIVVPVSVQGVADKGIISYEFDLRYDPAVIQPLAEPVDVVGTVSRALSVVTNGNEPGLLRVVVYGAFPIDSDGVLLNLRFNAVGARGSASALTFERIMFNEGETQVALSDGEVRLF